MNGNKSNLYDAIIVGGGPAGSCAALYANKIGLKTIILEKSRFPRDKVCGDALSGKVVRYMKELEILNEVSKLEGSTINTITFGSPNHKQFNVYLTNRYNKNIIKEGYAIKRSIFDNFLFNKANQLTDTKLGFKVNKILYNNKKIIGVEGLNNNNNKEKIYAPIILGCDGANSTIAKKLGLYTDLQKNSAMAIRCYYKNVKNLKNQIELHFVDEVLPGYFWLFPVGKNTANIGIGLSKEQAKKDTRKLSTILDDVTNSNFFRKRFKDSKKIDSPKSWVLPLGRVKRINYGDGFMLLGDAAGLIDPFTGEGIGNAMASAKFAIKIASKCLEKNDFSSKLTSEYNKILWTKLGSELKTSSRLQDLANYRVLLNFVMGKASSNKNVQDIISGMLAKEIPKERLTNPLFYLKILLS
ncbi:MAG: hypothetical protein CMG50_04330 [Candidatus Marinimicrobia bacterium]|nr:hypothetical protein [Candidatus Neomarinimicrobiota bacterium]|tara:strand:- start:7850 stop:9085 length:1236 start_codon:yes stop_codon:yes gene_type:complete